jgi:hypothetical protein
MMKFLLLSAFLALAPNASAQPAGTALGLPLDKPRLQSLLQTFVDQGYGRSFRRLGDESDFDHGHLLVDARTGAPVAILYHTQELADEDPAGYLDASGRNWIQWLDGRVENAGRYERADYPSTATWDWFVASQLPGLRGRHTITDKMLDPKKLGAELGKSRQWTFTRAACGTEAGDSIRVTLPTGAVCLALGAS